jgi:hypothetical protein
MTIEAIDLEVIELFEAGGYLVARTDDGDRIAITVLPDYDTEQDGE